jgi:hypothetical protein
MQGAIPSNIPNGITPDALTEKSREGGFSSSENQAAWRFQLTPSSGSPVRTRTNATPFAYDAA